MSKIKCILLLFICLFSFVQKPKAITNIEVSNASLIPYFQKETKNYNIYVNENVEQIEIKCTKEENEEVTNEGVHHLAKGENEIKIEATNNGIKETYTLNITRGTEEVDPSSADLKTLEIEGYQIDFQKDKLNYEINVDTLVNELNVKYTKENVNATVKLTGGTNLNNTENLIEIKVTSENQTNSKIYRIKVYKVLPTFNEEKELQTNIFGKTSLTKKEKTVTAIVIGLISILMIQICYIILFKKRKKKRKN